MPISFNFVWRKNNSKALDINWWSLLQMTEQACSCNIFRDLNLVFTIDLLSVIPSVYTRLYIHFREQVHAEHMQGQYLLIVVWMLNVWSVELLVTLLTNFMILCFASTYKKNSVVSGAKELKDEPHIERLHLEKYRETA